MTGSVRVYGLNREHSPSSSPQNEAHSVVSSVKMAQGSPQTGMSVDSESGGLESLAVVDGAGQSPQLWYTV